MNKENGKKFYQEIWFWVIIAVVVLGSVFMITSNGKDNDGASTQKAISESKKETNKSKESKTKELSTTYLEGEEVDLPAGNYEVGEDIKEGTYIVTVSEGDSGNFMSDANGNSKTLDNSINVIMATPEKKESSDSYKSYLTQYHAILTKGQKIELSSIGAKFEPIKKKENISKGSLMGGTYLVGQDVKAGKYKFVAESGSGNFFIKGSTYGNELMSKDKKDNYIQSYSSSVKNGDSISFNLQEIKLEDR